MGAPVTKGATGSAIEAGGEIGAAVTNGATGFAIRAGLGATWALQQLMELLGLLLEQKRSDLGAAATKGATGFAIGAELAIGAAVTNGATGCLGRTG